MAFWDIFSGTAGRNAAIWGAGNEQAGETRQLGQIDTGQTTATNAINRGADLSLSALDTGYTTGRNDINTHFDAGRAVLGQGLENSVGTYNRNPAILQGAADRSDAFYAPLGAEANRGYSAYGDAAGINGAAGQDRARSNFRAGPGYQFMVDEGVNAAARAANATGMGASGNTMDAVTRLGTNMADQEFDDYVARLNPYLTLAPNIAGSRAGIQTQLGQDLAANNAAIAGLYTGYGKDAAGLLAQEGTSLASLASGHGSNVANIRTGQAGNLSNIATNAGASRSNIIGGTNDSLTSLGTSGMVAGQQGNANAWNAGMQVANLAADTAGKFKNPFA